MLSELCFTDQSRQAISFLCNVASAIPYTRNSKTKIPFRCQASHMESLSSSSLAPSTANISRQVLASLWAGKALSTP